MRPLTRAQPRPSFVVDRTTMRTWRRRQMLRRAAHAAIAVAFAMSVAALLSGCDEVHVEMTRGEWIVGVALATVGAFFVAATGLVVAFIAGERALRSICQRLMPWLPWGGR